MTIDQAIAEFGREQHALITLDQLWKLGLSPRAVDYRVQIGRLERLEPRLFRIAGSPESWYQRVHGACLSVGPEAVSCRRTAAVLWGLLELDDPPVEIAVPRPRHPKWVSARVFRSTDIIRAHRTKVAGIPATSIPRTLVDLGAVCSHRVVEDAVERAVVREMTTVRELHRMLDNVARQGRRGVGALRSALDGMAEGTESILEAKLLRLILRSTLPSPVVQYKVRIGERLVARLDMAYPKVMLAIEADGRDPHSTAKAFQRDRQRQNELQQLGWIVLRFTWHDVTHRPEYVITAIRDMLRRRGRSWSRIAQ